jgi:hypothetical protein
MLYVYMFVCINLLYPYTTVNLIIPVQISKKAICAECNVVGIALSLSVQASGEPWLLDTILLEFVVCVT